LNRSRPSAKSIPCAAWRIPFNGKDYADFTEDITREIARLQRNYQFLSYGLIVAWLILVVYVLMMVARSASSGAKSPA